MFWSIFFSFLPVLIKFWHNKFQIMLYFHSCQDTIRLPLGWISPAQPSTAQPSPAQPSPPLHRHPAPFMILFPAAGVKGEWSTAALQLGPAAVAAAVRASCIDTSHPGPGQQQWPVGWWIVTHYTACIHQLLMLLVTTRHHLHIPDCLIFVFCWKAIHSIHAMKNHVC